LQVFEVKWGYLKWDQYQFRLSIKFEIPTFKLYRATARPVDALKKSVIFLHAA